MSLRSVARELGLSKTTLLRRIADGQIGAYRDGRRVIVPREEIERYRRSRPSVGPVSERGSPAVPASEVARFFTLPPPPKEYRCQSDSGCA